MGLMKEKPKMTENPVILEPLNDWDPDKKYPTYDPKTIAALVKQGTITEAQGKILLTP